MSKTRARLAILSELLAFPTVTASRWDVGFADSRIQKGDLISICSGPPSKWFVSWLIDYEVRDDGFTHYLLESIDDGELCWWTNVGINIYDRERVREHPTWKWTDKQFAFKNRWDKVCYRQNDAYIVLPLHPIFRGNSVELGVRVRFGIREFSNPIVFEDWKRLTNKRMGEYYRECVSMYESLRPITT